MVYRLRMLEVKLCLLIEQVYSFSHQDKGLKALVFAISLVDEAA